MAKRSSANSGWFGLFQPSPPDSADARRGRLARLRVDLAAAQVKLRAVKRERERVYRATVKSGIPAADAAKARAVVSLDNRASSAALQVEGIRAAIAYEKKGGKR